MDYLFQEITCTRNRKDQRLLSIVESESAYVIWPHGYLYKDYNNTSGNGYCGLIVAAQVRHQMNYQKYRVCKTESNEDQQFITKEIRDLYDFVKGRSLDDLGKYVEEQRKKGLDEEWYEEVSMCDKHWENMQKMLTRLFETTISVEEKALPTDAWLDTMCFQFVCRFLKLSCNVWYKIDINNNTSKDMYLVITMREGKTLYCHGDMIMTENFTDNLSNVLMQEIDVFYSDDHFFIADATMKRAHKKIVRGSKIVER